MKYRCPLCLKELTATDKFVRYCTNFENGCLPEVFECTPANLQTKIFCKNKDCQKDFNGAEGVFLLHKQCSVRNPFFINETDGTRRLETGLTERSARGVYVPPNRQNNQTVQNVVRQTQTVIPNALAEFMGEPSDNNFEEVLDSPNNSANDTKSETIGFTHWLLKFMRLLPSETDINNKLPNAHSDILECFPGKEMWFPLPLFRAVTEKDSDNRKCAAMIQLHGAKAVGKTIVATQSMNRKGYKNTGFIDHALAGDFVLTQLAEGQSPSNNSPMMADLCLNYILLNSIPNVFLPEGTENSLGTLKVSFFNKASLNTKTSPEEEKKTIIKEETVEKAKGLGATVKAVFSGFFGNPQSPDEARKDVDKFANIFVKTKDAELKPAKGDFNYALVFYDTKGEHGTTDNIEIRDIKRGTDKIVMFVSATEIVAGTGDSLLTVNQELRGNKSNKPFCLVITKIDELTNNELKKSLVDLADNIGTEQEESCRKIMLEILSETHRDNMNQGSEFCSQVNKPNTTVKIFPIWTEGLSKEGKTIQPRTFGMDKFVNWCFGFDIVG